MYISALKIHVSAATKSLLDQFGTFELQLRGEVEMKVRSQLSAAYNLLSVTLRYVSGQRETGDLLVVE